jgi:hypothetical protein
MPLEPVEEVEIYAIVMDRESGEVGIRHGRCHRTSWNPSDVRERFCGACGRFMEHEITEVRRGR